MQEWNMRLIIVIIGICLLLSQVQAFPCEGGGYTVGKTSLTLATGVANSSDYTPRTGTVWWFGELNATGEGFSAYSGLFELLRMPSVTPPITATIDDFSFSLKSTYFDERTRQQEPIPFEGCEWKEIAPPTGEYEICNDDVHNMNLLIYTVGYPSSCGNTADFIHVSEKRLKLSSGECKNIYLEARYPLESNCTQTFYNDITVASHRFGVVIDGRGNDLFIPVKSLKAKCEGEFCWWCVLLLILIILTAYIIYRKKRKKDDGKQNASV